MTEYGIIYGLLKSPMENRHIYDDFVRHGFTRISYKRHDKGNPNAVCVSWPLPQDQTAKISLVKPLFKSPVYKPRVTAKELEQEESTFRYKAEFWRSPGYHMVYGFLKDVNRLEFPKRLRDCGVQGGGYKWGKVGTDPNSPSAKDIVCVTWLISPGVFFNRDKVGEFMENIHYEYGIEEEELPKYRKMFWNWAISSGNKPKESAWIEFKKGHYDHMDRKPVGPPAGSQGRYYARSSRSSVPTSGGNKQQGRGSRNGRNRKDSCCIIQ